MKICDSDCFIITNLNISHNVLIFKMFFVKVKRPQVPNVPAAATVAPPAADSKPREKIVFFRVIFTICFDQTVMIFFFKSNFSVWSKFLLLGPENGAQRDVAWSTHYISG